MKRNKPRFSGDRVEHCRHRRAGCGRLTGGLKSTSQAGIYTGFWLERGLTDKRA